MPNSVKNTTFVSLLDLIAPHSCRGCGCLGNILCDRCKNNIISSHINICPICKTINPTGKCSRCSNFPPTFVVDEKSTLIGELLQTYKYQSVRALAKPLAEILFHILPQTPHKTQQIIVSLPTISKHIRERSFDHTYLIAKSLAKLSGPNCQVQKILLRNQNTVQVGADRNTRLIQAKSAYTISPHIDIDPNATYILLDDVWTTGASMQSAIKKLQQAGANNLKIAILALSRID